ncbi:MAG TPA: glycosyltransferase family 1 protein [Terriglobia bacterium]|nr:glycosyltransferase family 1 protein [Terriglobia bacterium]
MLRIAIDGTLFTAKPKGVSRYLGSLLAEIAKIDHANEYHVFIDKRVGPSVLPQQKNFLCRRVNFRTNLYWKLFQFRQVLKQERFDVVHLPSEGRSMECPYPCVVTVHEIPRIRWQLQRRVGIYAYLSQALNERMFAQTIGKMNAVITVSEATRADLLKWYPVDPARVTITHEAAEAQLLERIGSIRHDKVRQELGANEGYILTFATGDPRENVQAVLEAYGKIRHRLPHKLVICGTGQAARKKLRECSIALGIQDSTVFRGYVDDAVLAGFYAAADLYVDISYYEGFGLQVCEAMAFGVPVIASNIPALAELIGAAGYLVPRDDPVAAAAAMARVLEDQDEWNKRARLSRERAREFSWQRTAKRTLAIYQAVATQ